MLLGLGGAAYDKSCESTGALLNSHDIRDLGVTVNDKAKRYGGDQCSIINEDTIPLSYRLDGEPTSNGPVGKIMSF